MKKLIPIAIALTLSACGAKFRARQGEPNLVQPTPQEQVQIAAILKKISDLTSKFGPRRVFTRIPVYITTEDPKAAGRSAYCSSGEYIALNRYLLSTPATIALAEPLLLHEIGHCYFGRGH